MRAHFRLFCVVRFIKWPCSVSDGLAAHFPTLQQCGSIAGLMQLVTVDLRCSVSLCSVSNICRGRILRSANGDRCE